MAVRMLPKFMFKLQEHLKKLKALVEVNNSIIGHILTH